MNNPWLSIRLDDYEGHMALPDVRQSAMLDHEFEALLRRHRPTSAAVIGCAGGNGFASAAGAGVTRLVGLDINPAYIADAQARYAADIPGLELHCLDIQKEISGIEPVDLVYAALVFEYVDSAIALANLRILCRSGGILVALLQAPKDGEAAVSPSPFVALDSLNAIMRLVPPVDFCTTAEKLDLLFLEQRTITLVSGKQFCILVFQR
jgi:SAM-dependent methyltransferase